MTSNCNITPNHIRLTGDTLVSAYFGAMTSLTAVSLPGPGHHPHITARFKNGAVLSLDPATATQFARELPAALLKLGVLPDCSAIASEVAE